MLEKLNRICEGSFIGTMGIVFTALEEGAIEATMPVGDKLQPIGILHGGASLTLAESVASAGSYMLIDPEKFDAVGLQVSANHVGHAREGMLHARAEILHHGRTTHVWDVFISDDQGKLICLSRVTIMVISKV